MERLYVLDGSGYIYRAYFGIGGASRRSAKLTTSWGLPTGALYVFAQMLVKLSRETKPTRVAVVFDAPGRTFRKDLHDEYKANRRETPEDLKPQLPYFSKITEALAWPVLSVPGVEADDVIATVVGQARARDWAVTIISGDKDLLQLVGDGVDMVDSLRDETYDAARVQEKYGITPGQLRDYLALVGDTSDNVPGMPGVGAKTASRLLARYGSIDGILDHAGEFKGKQKERFTDPDLLAQMRLSRELVTLVADVDYGADLDALVADRWDDDTMRALLRDKLEFHSLYERLSGVSVDVEAADATAGAGAGAARAPAQQTLPRSDAGGAGGAGRPGVEAVRSANATRARRARWAAEPIAVPETVVAATADDLAPLIAAARSAGRMVVTVDTDGVRPDRARVVGIALAASGVAPIYIPIGHRYLGAPPQFDIAGLPADLIALLADPGFAIVCHDAKTARRILAQHGVALDGVVADTMLAMYLIDADESVEIHDLLRVTTGIALPARKTLLGKGRTKIDYESVVVERAAPHAGTAAHGILAAEARLSSALVEDGLAELMDDVELPLARLLADIEQVGVCLDVVHLRDLSRRVGEDIAALERKVFELAGEEINLGSPKQLQALLFETLGLTSEKMKKTKTGYSTDHEVLEGMMDAHPVVPLVVEHRELIKLKGTYLDALPPLVNPNTGRLHTSFHQAVAATGRLSSQDPNLQNIPVRTELGRDIRRAFVAAPDRTLVSVDYSQIELRILAHLSHDPVLCEAFRRGVDVHTQTAAEVFDMPLDKVGADERRVAKAVNYGLVYGQSAFGLAQTLGIGRREAETYISRYFERFATVREFMEDCIRQARSRGEAITVLGRRRPLPEIGSKRFQRRKMAERMAQNTPMQGSAADIMKLAMLRVAERMQRESFDARMLLTVHDELVFEVVPDQAEAFAEVAAGEMRGAYELSVPLDTTVGIATNWADAH